MIFLKREVSTFLHFCVCFSDDKTNDFPKWQVIKETRLSRQILFAHHLTLVSRTPRHPNDQELQWGHQFPRGAEILQQEVDHVVLLQPRQSFPAGVGGVSNPRGGSEGIYIIQ